MCLESIVPRLHAYVIMIIQIASPILLLAMQNNRSDYIPFIGATTPTSSVTQRHYGTLKFLLWFHVTVYFPVISAQVGKIVHPVNRHSDRICHVETIQSRI